jgi:hypothetical protein
MKSRISSLFIIYLIITLSLAGCPRKPDTYTGTVSGANGGEISAGDLALSFPKGVTAGEIAVQIKKENARPEIKGSPELVKAYKDVKVLSDIYGVTVDQSSFDKSVYLELKFDPAMVKGDELYVCSVANGKLETAEVIAGDLEDGYIIVKADHFSTWFVAAGTALLATLIYVGYKAYTFGKNENQPWSLIEPDHPKILNFIKENSLKLPEVGPKAERFAMVNYHKKFGARNDTYFNRVVHLTGNKGSDVLNQQEAACWDLTAFFGSILYGMQPDMSQKIRLVKGTLNGNRHSWIEIVVGGQVFVVNTARTDTFEFVARDILYKEQNLKPTDFYTKAQGSLKPYNPEWFKPLLSDISARIEELKAEHRKLQEELERLAALGEDLTDADVARMDEIRTQQKAIYNQVMALKAQLTGN